MKANKFVFNGSVDESQIPKIKDSIRFHDGISAVRVDTNAKTVTVDYDEARYSEEDIKNFVSQTGLNIQQVK